MARTPVQAKALETKALAAKTKSDGMRMLFEAGYSALEVKEVMGVVYSFAYGVGVRGGFIEPTPRAPKAEKAPAKAKAAKAAPAKVKTPVKTKAAPAKVPARTARVARTGGRATAKV